MSATILELAPGSDITPEIAAAIGASPIAQIVIDESDAPGSLPEWFARINEELPAEAAQVWVIAERHRLADVLQDGHDAFGASRLAGISTWETGARGTGGFSADTRYIIVWKVGPNARPVALGRSKRTVTRPLTRRGRRQRTLEFVAGSMSFPSDEEIIPARTAGNVSVSAMTVVDGENWGTVTIAAPFSVDQPALDLLIADGGRAWISGDGDEAQVLISVSQEAGRPFPSHLSPRLSNVTSVAEAVRHTKEITGRRVARAVPESLAEMIISAGSRRGELVVTIGGACAAIPAASRTLHRKVVHVVRDAAAVEVAEARLLAAGGKIEVRSRAAATNESRV